MFSRSSLLSATALSLTLFIPLPAAADAETEALREQVKLMQQQMDALQRKLDQLEKRQARSAVPSAPAPVHQSALEQRVAVLERKDELNEEDAKAKAAKTPSIKLSPGKGVTLAAPDNSYSLTLRGYAQADARSFLGDDDRLNTSSFLIRRARPILEGKAGDFGFRLMPDFAGTTRLFDGYAEYTPYEAFNLRLGKFKPPIGLDRLKSAMDLSFTERSMPTNLAPNRDLGFMAYGSVIPELAYEIGLFNGASDLGNDDTDVDDHKDIAARIFAHPFKQSFSALQGLGLGVGGSWGSRDGSLTNRQVGDYRTPAQARFFAYRASTFGDGRHWRLAPQGYYYYGPFGAMMEYTISSQEVRNGANTATLRNEAWETQISYVLTGEDASYKGWPKPNAPFDLAKGQWGAWEIAGRYGQLSIDNRAFGIYADPFASARKARAFGAALNGYLNSQVKLTLDYEHTIFDGGAAAGADRDTEQVIITRAGYNF